MPNQERINSEYRQALMNGLSPDDARFIWFGVRVEPQPKTAVPPNQELTPVTRLASDSSNPQA